MRKTNLADFGDILQCATRHGYNWNQAHEILVNDEIPPMYESPTQEYYLSDLGDSPANCAYSWSEDTWKILKAFFAQEGVDEFTLTQ